MSADIIFVDLLATDESDAANSDTFIVGSVIQTLL
jgi:hypothetical protein